MLQPPRASVFFSSQTSRFPGRGTTLLTVVLLLTVSLSMWLGYEAFAAARDHRTAVEATLRDYTGMAAWELSRLSRESVHWFVDETFDDLRDRRGDLRRAWALRHEMEEAADRRDCECPALIDPLIQLRVDYPTGRIDVVPGSLDPGTTDRVLRLLEERLAGPDARRQGFLVAGPGVVVDQAVGIGYTARGRDDDPVSTVYAFAVPVEGIGQLIEHWYRRNPLLPPSAGRLATNDSLLHGEVRSPEGVTVFSAAGLPTSDLASSDTVGAGWGGLIAEVDVRPGAASRLVAGGVPPSRTPLFLAMLALVVVAGATGLVLIRKQEELARLRDDFVSGVSHELRTPLAQIRMFAELHEAGKLRSEDDRRRAISVIDREARRLSHLVENVLQFTRLRRAPDPVTAHGRLDVEDALAEVLEGFRPLLASSDMTLRLETEPGLRVDMGSGSFRQILVNFLDNAVKYGPSGQTVTVRAKSGGPRTVHIMVEDEGPGVPVRERSRIWEPYRRLDRDIKARQPGTGIGLAVVAALARQHGGSAWVENAPGGGARFVVELRGLRTAEPEQPVPVRLGVPA